MNNIHWSKPTVTILLAIITCSCFAAVIDSTTARTAAQAWINNGYSMRHLSAKTVSDIRPLQIGNEKVHLAKLAEGGFIILAGDDRIDPVIAFSSTASEVATDPNSPLYALLTRDLKMRMAAMTNRTLRLSPMTSSATQLTTPQYRWEKLLKKSLSPQLMDSSSKQELSDVRVAPLVQSKWNQTKNSKWSNLGENCYNYYTPGNAPCGCAATVLSQLMRYHRYPTSVTAVTRKCKYLTTEKSYTMKGGVYDYDNMPLIPEADTTLAWYAGGATEAQRQAIGKLTYDCGVAMQMAWNTNSSSSGEAINGPIKEIFGYKNAHYTFYTAGLATATYREKIIHTNLDAGYPVMLSVSGGTGGHGIIADGYGYSDSITYTHLNMGWANEDDIWYALPNIDGHNTYTAINSIAYNIFPQESGEIVSGRIIDSTGNPIKNATVSIKKSGTSTVLKNTPSNDKGIFGFVVPANSSYVVTASFGSDTISASATTGTSGDSVVTLGIGTQTAEKNAKTVAVACGNFSCGDLKLSKIVAVQTPVINPNGGLFYPTASVSISCATDGATIRYTLDGSDPTDSSTLYTGAITIEDDATLKARAFKDGFNSSAIASATFSYDEAQGGPKGDFFNSPIKISGASGSYVIEDNAAYTVEGNEAHHTLENNAYYPQYHTCWYKWTAPGSGTITFISQLRSASNLIPSAIAIYSDGSSVPTSTKSRLAMAFNCTERYNEGKGYTSAVSLSVTQGTTYRIVGVPISESAGTFTLTWSGDLETVITETQGTEIPVPYAWLANYYPSANQSTYETLAKSLGANGIMVWESYLAGLDPTDIQSKLQATIRMKGQTPIIEWNVTNEAAIARGYIYKIFGCQSLETPVWSYPTNSTHRFFKVILEK